MSRQSNSRALWVQEIDYKGKGPLALLHQLQKARTIRHRNMRKLVLLTQGRFEAMLSDPQGVAAGFGWTMWPLSNAWKQMS